MKGLHRKISVVLLLAMLLSMFSSVGIYATDDTVVGVQADAVVETVAEPETAPTVMPDPQNEVVAEPVEAESGAEPVVSAEPEKTDSAEPVVSEEPSPAPSVDNQEGQASVDQDAPTEEVKDEAKEGAKEENTEKPQEEAREEVKENVKEESFYDQLMKLKTCKEIYDLLTDDANYDKAMALTVDQVKALRTYVLTLKEDDHTELLLDSINQLLIALGENVEDGEYGTESEWNNPNQGATTGTVDHIDIAVDLSATLYVDGKTVTQSYIMTKSDVKNVTVVDGSGKTYSVSYGNESSGSSGAKQIRLSGSFNVGTQASPTKFTVTLKKTVSYDGKNYDVEFTGTFGYWDSNNDCPGLDMNKQSWQNGNVIQGSGLDFTLSGTGASAGNIQIVKVIDGVTLTTGQTVNVTFEVKNSSGTTVATKTMTVTGPQNQLSTTIGNLEKGTYTVTETATDPITGYVLSSTTYQVGTDGTPGSGSASVTVTNGNTSTVIVKNTYEEDVPATKSLTVTKVWDDDDDNDGKRPGSVTVNLLLGGELTGKSGTLNAGNNWTYTFEGLDVNGNYTVAEVVPDGYTATYAYNNETNTVTITNTHTVDKTSLTVKKVWEDNNNQDGKRTNSVQVQLYATVNGKTVKMEKVAPVTLNKENDWSYTFTDLNVKYNGQVVTWTVQEIQVPDGYVATYRTVDGVYEVVNTHTPETTSVSGTKTWNDADDQDGIRPGSITVNLFANSKQVATKAVTAENGWKYEFTDLPKFENGKEIVYTIAEEAVEDYTTEVEGYNITNSHTPETVDIFGTKEWNDKENQDGKRPNSIEVVLYADGEVKATKTVTAEDYWKYEFKDLPMYKDGGTEIVYTIAEVKVDDYSTKVEGYDIYNSYTPAQTSVAVIKNWDDNNNQDGIRPDSVTVRLFADGKETQQSVILSAENNWSASFTGLDKYRNGGTEIVYTIAEDEVENYTASVERDENGVLIVTNTHEPEKLDGSISGTKTWNDNDNQDGKRPGSITVNLLANGEKVASQTVTAENGWKYEFTDLPKFENGKEIVYTIAEEAVKDYTGKVEGYNITNSHTPEKTQVSGTKTWDDHDNQDGIRPDSITVNLLADGEKVAYQTVTAENGWKYEFKNLDKYENGEEIEYTITEEAVEGYLSDTSGYDLINTHSVEIYEKVTVAKKWNDSDDKDGARPENIQVELLANGKVAGTLTLNAENNWQGAFENLPVNENGKEITYTIREVAVEGYQCSISGNVAKGWTISNTLLTDIVGKKTWNDSNDQDGVRPKEITVHLTLNGKVYRTTTTSAEKNWEYTFENVPKYNPTTGELVAYGITETSVNGYEAVTNGYNLTNTHEPEKLEGGISGTKTWDDNDNQDGKRPDSITVNLLANGEKVASQTVTAENGWKYEFKNLDKYYDGGKEIVYTITEEAVEGYTTDVDGYDLINTHEIEKITSISGEKTWNDKGNQDGIRPDSITVNLLANGKKVASQTVTAEDGWKYEFKNLDKYENGVEIKYTVAEEAVEGYTAKADGYDLTNTHEVEKITSISGEKTWNDKGNQDGIRPESITVNLLANGEKVASQKVTAENGWKYEFKNLDKFANGKEIVYTVTEDAVKGYDVAAGQGYDLVNTHVTETVELELVKQWADNDNQDGKRPDEIKVTLLANGVAQGVYTLTAKNGWSLKISGLDKNADGKEIVYTLQEEAVEGYTAAYQGTTIINSHEIEKTDITVTKYWVDNDNQDGIRPVSVTVVLLANGEELTRASFGADGVWTYTFENLDKYADGKEIVYTVEEVAVTGYTTKVEGYSITNTHEVEKITAISGEKTWKDNGNQDGIRPESITVNLLADGKKVASQTVTAENGWKYEFKNLDKYENGVEIKYTVEEVKVEGYTSKVNGYNITNTHEPEQLDGGISGTKTWNDNDNQDGIRPESITVNLLANGEKVASQKVTAENGWKYEFKNLDKYADGKEIVYTVEEVTVEGYTAQVNGYNIVNTHEVEKLEGGISGEKTWKDNDNQDGIRPESITVNLLANGKKVASRNVTAENGWKYEFKNLDKYENGVEIKYTITEEAVEGYTTEVEGYSITNTHETETTNVTIEKKWVDNNNKEGKRPGSITVQLYANGEKLGDAVKITAENDWKYEFKDLDKYQNGKLVEYTVKETSEKYYVAKYASKDGVLTITNTFVDIPLTGDTINLLFWTMMVLGAGAVLGGVGFYVRRRRT